MIRDDPDLRQTLIDLAPVYAAYRKAKGDAGRLDPVEKFQAHHAANAHAGDLFGTILGRADRFHWDGNGLVIILAAQAALRAKLKRRPSIVQMSKALEEESNTLLMAARKAKADADKAARVVEVAERKAAAAQAARLLYTGYSA
ncbi:hypothetical protein [Sphingomonas sp. GC_Shp_3]|uniref:hypothetical protein n=1 Tax=Sphingomonas sp. GC_Shp_3 TaxID=2937383 RepID=UPI00226AB5BF|nr:hypothetical protein [Sphingomonas sp. GC_Shp_3]